MQGIPMEIDTSVMLHPPKAKRALWVKATYSDILSNNNKQGASEEQEQCGKCHGGNIVKFITPGPSHLG
jgi:hypothetical protein